MTVFAQARAGETVVAVVNDRRVTQAEVDGSIAGQLFPLQQQIYALRKAALENLIVRAVLEQEASRRGVTVEELKKQLTGARVEVPASQVERLYLENASVFASMSPEEARERLRLDLESQARMKNYREAVSKLKEAARVELRLEEPRLSYSDGAADATPPAGAPEAAAVVTEFSDYQCSFCRESQNVVRRVLERYGGRVRLVVRHLPLEIHPEAFLAAQAAVCAGEQGFFRQYHDALYASASLSQPALAELASRLGLDAHVFKTCLDSDASRLAVLKDVREAKRLGVNSTPTYIINGKLFRGALGLDEFVGAVERELKSAGSPRQK